jgi:hypothetical protein
MVAWMQGSSAGLNLRASLDEGALEVAVDPNDRSGSREQPQRSWRSSNRRQQSTFMRTAAPLAVTVGLALSLAPAAPAFADGGAGGGAGTGVPGGIDSATGVGANGSPGGIDNTIATGGGGGGAGATGGVGGNGANFGFGAGAGGAGGNIAGASGANGGNVVRPVAVVVVAALKAHSFRPRAHFPVRPVVTAVTVAMDRRASVSEAEVEEVAAVTVPWSPLAVYRSPSAEP